MKSDRIVKWLFVAVVLFFAAMAVAPFLAGEETRKDSQAKAANGTENLRLK